MGLPTPVRPPPPLVVIFTGRNQEIHGAPEASSEGDVRAHRVCGEDSRAGARKLNKYFPFLPDAGKHY